MNEKTEDTTEKNVAVTEENATEEVGIEETEEMLIFLFTAGKAFKQAKANDGKIDMADFGLLMQVFPTVGPAFDGANKIFTEIKDIDANEADRLIALVAKKTGELVNKEQLVDKIIKGLAVAKAINEFVATF